MPSIASKQPSGAASTPVTRTPSRCGTGPVAASATTAGAAGGRTTTTSSPPPCAESRGRWCAGERLAVMSQRDIDRYLAALDEPKRSTLEALRQSILEVVPEAEQCISYGLPAFKVHGKVVAGFAAFKQHLSYLPHSGSVLS